MTSPAIRRGTPAFIRANVAFFLSAFSVFASLYSVQPLLPMFAQYWVRDAGTASLALSATTATMALALIPASLLADRLGRRTLIVSALLLTAILGCLLPFTQVWWQLITLRTLMGISLAGVPAVAMVYLSEEMDADALGYSMGLYIGGTALGGMAGRVISGILSDFLGWRVGTGGLAGLIRLPWPCRCRNHANYCAIPSASVNCGGDALPAFPMPHCPGCLPAHFC